MRNYKTFDEAVVPLLETEEDIQSYMDIALEEYQKDHDIKALMVTLRQIAKARGGIAKLAEQTGLGRESLYKALSGKTSPRRDTFGAILHTLGYRLDFKPLASIS
jgi:probable addiction module antidote protein